MARGFAHIPTFRAAAVVRLALALLLGLCGSSYAHAQADVAPGTVADGVLRDGVNAVGTVADIAPDVAATLPDYVAIVAAAPAAESATDVAAASAADVAPTPAASAADVAPAPAAETPVDSATAPVAETATDSATAPADSAAATSATEPDAETAAPDAETAAPDAETAAPDAETASPADTIRQWRLPEDRLAGKPYNKHFKSGEVLKGDPALVRPGFLLDQNLFGAQRLTTHGNFRFTEEFTIYYRRNKTDIDTSYLWNPAQITQLRSFLRKDIVVDTITVYAYASPEGHYGHNVWLSRQRAENARKYIVEEYGLDPGKVRICQQEENWPGLRQAVRNFYEGDNRDDLLEILWAEGLSDKERKDRIIALDAGKTYSYLIDVLMPPLRSAIFSITWSRRNAFDLPSVKWGGESKAERRQETKEEQQPQYPEIQQDTIAKRTIVALKTNVLYDAVTAINYQVEVPIGKNFSVVWEHYFPWWATKKELKYCLQYLTLGGEARWWFAPKPRPETKDRVLRDVLVGHYIGAYGLWGKADLQWQDKFGMYQCAPILSAGLTYGFVTPITKHLNLELSVSAGYARIPYQHYIPSEDWQILWRDRNDAGITHYFGPTKVTVTLSMPILINYKPRKR